MINHICLLKNFENLLFSPKCNPIILQNKIDEITNIISEKVKGLVQTCISQLDSDLTLLKTISNQVLIDFNTRTKIYQIFSFLEILSLILFCMTLKTGKLFGLGPFYWPLLLTIFFFWIISYRRKPSKANIKEVQIFMNINSHKIDEKLQSFKTQNSKVAKNN